MMLTAIFHMLSTYEVWNPTDLKKNELPESVKERNRRHEIKKAIQRSKEKGMNRHPGQAFLWIKHGMHSAVIGQNGR